MLKEKFKEILKETLTDDSEHTDMIDYLSGRLFQEVVDWLPRYIAECTAKAVIEAVKLDLKELLREELYHILIKILAEKKEAV